jgi:hypothetical protein
VEPVCCCAALRTFELRSLREASPASRPASWVYLCTLLIPAVIGKEELPPWSGIRPIRHSARPDCGTQLIRISPSRVTGSRTRIGQQAAQNLPHSSPN